MAGQFQKTLTVELMALLVVALVFRVGLTAWFFGFNQSGQTSDDREFEAIGWTLAQAGRYAEYPDSPPTARRAPLLPLLLAGVYSVAGHQRAVAQAALIFISALTAPLAALLGREIANRRAGLLAGLATAIDPFAWIFAGIFYSEALFTFVFVLSVLMIIRAVKSPNKSSLLWLGVVLAGCALARSNGLAAGVAGVLLLPLAGAGRPAVWLKRAGVVLAIFILCLTPWIGRNFLVFNRFIPATSQMGEVLLGVYNDTCLQYRCNEWVAVYLLPEYTEHRLAELDELARNDAQTRLALESIRANPVAWAGLLPTKLIRFWMHNSILPNTPYRANPPQLLVVYQQFYYQLLLILGLAGLFALYVTGRRAAFIILTGYLAVFSLVTLLFWGDARFRMPLHPLLAVAGAYLLTALYDRIFPNRRARRVNVKMTAMF